MHIVSGSRPGRGRLQPGRNRTALVYVVLSLLVLGGGIACDELNDFKTSKGEVYRGGVVGAATTYVRSGDGGTSEIAQGDSFLLHGFEPGTWLELSFDPESAIAGKQDVGSVITYTCMEVGLSRCPEALRVDGPLASGKLKTIPGLQEDALSRYGFPGGSRIRNFILDGVFLAGATERHAMVFLSLMESGHVELRVVAPRFREGEGAAPVGGWQPALFGVFQLSRGTR